MTMFVKSVSRDGDYGIFVREEDNGENVDFYFSSKTGKVLGPKDGFTPEQFQLALEASRRPGI
jgi:hypothetical protein